MCADELDSDSSGYLDREEVSALGTKCGKVFNVSELDAAMRWMDKDNTGRVSFEAFQNWWTSWRSGMQADRKSTAHLHVSSALDVEKAKRRSERSATEDLMAAHERIVGDKKMRSTFSSIDTDGSGSLDAEELGVFVRKLKPTRFMGPRQVAEAMSEMDSDGSGRVSFDEFAAWWRAGGSLTTAEALASRTDSISDSLSETLAALEASREARAAFEKSVVEVALKPPLVLSG